MFNTDPDELALSKVSSSLTLVLTANISLEGGGANRSVTITPTAGLSGTATITITVSDGELAAFDAFVLTVEPFRVYLLIIKD